MGPFKSLFLSVLLMTSYLQVQCADKYTDENRPYEFGFNIEGEQHRHEKKDENGIIMGEFGFITADGVYHVTVYATDENGNFKILSMKNIRVKPYPSGLEKKGHSLPFPPSQNPPQTQGPTRPPPPKPISIEPPAKSCSHCSIPTSSTQAPQLTDLAVVSQDQNPPFGSNVPQYNQPGGPQNYPNKTPSNANYPQQGFGGDQSNYGNQGPSNTNYPQGFGGDQSNYGNQGPSDTNYPQQGFDGNQPNYQNQDSFGLNSPQPGGPDGAQYPGVQGSISGDRNPKQFNDFPPQGFGQSEPGQQYDGANGLNGQQGGSNKPVLISAQMQIVDKNTDIHRRGPGEKEGLPNGLTKDDMTNLLYTFNYTVGFHGHHEEGYVNGAKVGYYYVTGRNGIRTRVDYVADEKGFRPKITQEVLDLLSDDVPKPETEKDEKYGLKGYEFKWLYYPTDPKKQ